MTNLRTFSFGPYGHTVGPGSLFSQEIFNTAANYNFEIGFKNLSKITPK